MTQEINEELFEHLVLLAALQLEPDEARYLRGELNRQLKAVDTLRAIPLDPEVPTAAHGVSYTPQTSQPARDDLWEPYPDPRRLLELAPETQDGYFVVPKTPHTEI